MTPKQVEHKTVGATIKQAGDDGSFEAEIATLGVIDHDGDIVERGAFSGHPIAVLPAHDSQHVPLGKAQIVERGDIAVATGQFNLEIEAARDWHSSLKFDLEKVQPPVQQWSWGFRIMGPDGFRADQVDGQPVRRLIKLDEREVSPVLRGASLGTRTVHVKRRKAEGMSDNDLRERLEHELLEVEGELEHLWVEAVFDDAVVYHARRADEAGRTLERSWAMDGETVTFGDEATVVVRDVSYVAVGKDDAGGAPDDLKLIDQVLLTTYDVEATIARVLDAVDARGKRGRTLGADSKAAAMAMAGQFAELDRTMGQLRGMADQLLPQDLAARAAAKFLALTSLREPVPSA
ncbi:hypothetical protein LCGC14_0568080 [marine sediment metagenome]|uniref:Uncharacterized protein n=1 Tax=marine sediment metagenome TaxID=412755 RepID=A0A0F9UTD4_9ZZZZ